MMSKQLALSMVVMSVSTVALAQSGGHDHSAPPEAKAAAVPSDMQKAFDELKTLAGAWEGRLTTDPPAPEADGKLAQVSLRVTSMGHALMHDMKIDGRPDNPITMLVVDADRLLLTHYCDADNRPRMTGKRSADGKRVEFDFVDVSGNLKYGHMHHVVFTFVDANHHIEEWTWMAPGDKAMRARFELQRAASAGATSGS
jgi:hypothetical protein